MIDNGNREDETNDNQQSMLLGNADLYEHSFISSDSNSSECEVNTVKWYIFASPNFRGFASKHED